MEIFAIIASCRSLRFSLGGGTLSCSPAGIMRFSFLILLKEIACYVYLQSLFIVKHAYLLKNPLICTKIHYLRTELYRYLQHKNKSSGDL